jgi:putative transposase
MILPSRKHPVHGVRIEVHSPVIIFLTVCAKNRSPWLASNEVHHLLHELWVRADAWLVGDYVLMPDHLHLFAAPNPGNSVELDKWVQYWKSQFTKRHSNSAHRWQTDHWDRRVREEENYASKWEYVRNNPVRHKLVIKPEERPYQGTIYQLVW